MKNILFFLFIVFSSFVIKSQSSTLKGIVNDLSGPIPGAIILLEKTNFNTVSDFDGLFSISKIPAGNYTLQIYVLGYDKIITPISIAEGETKDIGKQILREPKQLQEVTVTTEMRNSENKAINMIKNSTRVVSVVSAEGIAKLPNKNAADVVARIPGASVMRSKGEGSMISLRGTPMDWTATFLNGDRLPVADEENTTRSFEFQILPSDMIDYVIVSKSSTPDMESDNIGGSINFLSRAAVTKKTFKLNVASGYNPLAQKPTGTFNFLYGDISKNKKLSFVINGSSFGRYYATDAYKIIYGNNFNHGLNRYELRRYDGTRLNLAANSAIEYRFNDRFKIGAHSVYSYMTDDKYQKKQSYNWYDGSGSRIRLQNIHGKLNRKLYGGDIYTELNITQKMKIKARAAMYENEFRYGNVPYNKHDARNGYYIMEFISPLLQFTDLSNVNQAGEPLYNIDPNDPPPYLFPVKLIGEDEPFGKGDDPYNIQPKFKTIFGKSLEAKDFEYYQSYTEINTTRERDAFIGQFDWDYKLTNSMKLQVGTKYRSKNGSRQISKHEWFKDYSIPGHNNPFLLTDFENVNFSQTSGGFLKELGANYQDQFFPFVSQNALNTFLIEYKDSLREKVMDKENQEYRLWVGSSYTYTETQLGTYFLTEYNTDKLNIIAGFRFENTKLLQLSDTLTTKTYQDPVTGSFYNIPEQRTTDKNYNAYLPSINTTYHVNDNDNIRVAFSQSMKRPNFEQTKPGAAVIKLNDLQNIIGNPKLQPTYAYNYDLCFEHFWSGKGMWSFGAYFKDVYNHIFSVSTSDFEPESGITIKRYDNADRAKVYGIEATFIRKFDFLPGFFKGFGINANATLSDSRMKVPGRPNAQKMTEQTPLLYNVALIYEKNGFNSRLAVNYVGKHLKELNLSSIVGGGLLHTDTDFDVFMNRYYNLDFQFSYTFNKFYTFYLEANNMLNYPERKYIGKEFRALRTEYYRTRFQIGFRIDI
ncbi:MAG: TonB-dependent receptor [Bacteroidota bacterium]|nr:TonB-dependent receptor [Bacteroidota bacterium]